MDKMSREDLMKKIKNLEFTGVELTLYLDNHPTNQQAVADYNMVSQELDKYKKMYEMHYGPLCNFGHSPSQCPWKWVEDPWPWESGE